MKSLKKVFFVLCTLLALPFFSKAAAIGSATLPSLTINYVDYGYGALTCRATTNLNNPQFTKVIASNTNYTYAGYAAAASSFTWQFLTISAGGITEADIDFLDLESQTIGVNYGYHYVSATRGTAPVFTIKRNSPYNYTITAWLITM
jgi:hypothetical protein